MCMQGFFQSIVAQFATHDVALDVFRTGRERPRSEHHSCCFCGTDRFFRPRYDANLLNVWIPALSGVGEKLDAGIRVADIGCGHGSSTIIMAKQFPNSMFYGFDYHEPSIEEASRKASQGGVTNVQFQISSAKEIPDNRYGLACIFDALHDMGDPVGTAKRIRDVLNDDGTFMLVEPVAQDSLADKIPNNSMSGAFYSFSTLVCVPASKSQEVGLALGAQAGQVRLTGVLNEAGFTHIQRVSENPSNMVLEVRA
ncbi:MAG: class I SAM-dependent methyltransferase [Pseudomonadales bacterium]